MPEAARALDHRMLGKVAREVVEVTKRQEPFRLTPKQQGWNLQRTKLLGCQCGARLRSSKQRAHRRARKSRWHLVGQQREEPWRLMIQATEQLGGMGARFEPKRALQRLP